VEARWPAPSLSSFLREEKKLLKHVRTLGEYFRAALEGLDKKHKSILDVRGVGLMQAVELDSPDLRESGRQATAARWDHHQSHTRNRAAFSASLRDQKKHVDQVIEALDAALRKNAELRIKQEKGAPRRKEAHAHA
jgi:4-aminobutyrate aminotransferase-like enzyme